MDDPPPIIHSLSIAEFDIDKGNTLTIRYPDFEIPGHSHQDLANLCIPDGAHIHQEDWTYLIIRVPEDHRAKHSAKKAKNAAKNPTETQDEDQNFRTLYGIGFFRNKRDETVRRGAIQKSLLILSEKPYFNLYRPMARAAIYQLMDSGDKKALSTLYEALNKNIFKKSTVTVWNEKYDLNLPVLKEDMFHGATLMNFIKIFQMDTILIWKALLMQLRVLFVGQPANQVGSCCLSAPLLVAPLHGWEEIMSPYVALTDIEPIMKPSYICASTNLMFEHKSDWWDVLCSVTNHSVTDHANVVRVTSKEKSFMKSVLAGIASNKGESWVRIQFESYTRNLLSSIEAEKIKPKQRPLYDKLKASTMFANYVKSKDSEDSSAEMAKSPANLIKKLKQESENYLAARKVLFDISKALDNLTAIDEFLDNGGLELVSDQLFTATSSQVKKMCTSILAEMAISVRCQVAIITSKLFGKIIELVEDPMPNVKSAALGCITKISSLFIGAVSLLKRNVDTDLFKLLVNAETNIELKTLAAQALTEMSLLLPGKLESLDFVSIRAELVKAQDPRFRGFLVQLLDIWSEKISNLPINPNLTQFLVPLNDPKVVDKSPALTILYTHLSSEPISIFQFIQLKGIPVLLDLWNNFSPPSPIPRQVIGIFNVLGSTNIGLIEMQDAGICDLALDSIKTESTSDLYYIFGMLRLFTIFCQNRQVSTSLCTEEYLQKILHLITVSIQLPLLNQRCFPLFKCIKLLHHANPSATPLLRKTLAPLLQFYKHPLDREVENPADEDFLQTMLKSVCDSIGLIPEKNIPEAIYF